MAKQKTKKQDNTLPVLTHILGLLTSFIGPLIVLLATEDKNSKKHAKTALNWQFSIIIYFIALVVLSIISVILTVIYIGFFLIPLVVLAFIALYVLDFVFCILAAVKAGEGKLWKYPFSIPFFKI